MALSNTAETGVAPAVAPRSVTILGSTGSVGCNTVDLIEREPDKFRVEALVANSSVERLAGQARRLRPKMVAVADETAYGALKDALAGTGIEVGAGPAAVMEAALRPAECVMAAIVGAARAPADAGRRAPRRDHRTAPTRKHWSAPAIW